jgi:hypothetical protein
MNHGLSMRPGAEGRYTIFVVYGNEGESGRGVIILGHKGDFENR